MATMTVQLNTRIERSLKAGGDAVLARNGINPSDAVRALWRYLTEKQTLPAFLQHEETHSDEPASLAEAGFGLAYAIPCSSNYAESEHAATEYERELDAMRDDMYDAMLADIEENCR